MTRSRLTRMTMPVLACLLAALVAACGDNGAPDAGPSTSDSPSGTSPSSAAPTGSPSVEPVASTPRLDSIVVLGHSGTTGYGSDPSNPQADVRDNSWATGSNPDVSSIYRRLLVDHPTLKGHATSLGVDGSTVDDLAPQTDELLALDPLPDVVVIQTIDNDIRCDGSDPANYRAFGRKLDAVLSRIETEDRHAQVFLVSQPASVQIYADAVLGLPQVMRDQSGDGVCDTFTAAGKERPQGIAALQKIVDAYFAEVVKACARHDRCWTDKGAMQAMPLRPGDLTIDGGHLSVAGANTMAPLAWSVLPAEIKNRP